MNQTDIPTFRVSEMGLEDVQMDLQILVNQSPANVDGITLQVDPDPATDPADQLIGQCTVLARFTDAAGHHRVARIQMSTSWVEDSCTHQHTAELEAGGVECVSCGTIVELQTPDLHCPGCDAPVLDSRILFGVHTATCPVAVRCQCEHVAHTQQPLSAHPYLGVPAGSHRAQFVGAVCDECATGHLADYLLPETIGADHGC